MLVKFSYSASRRVSPVDRGGKKRHIPKNGPPHKPRKRRDRARERAEWSSAARAASGEGCRLYCRRTSAPYCPGCGEIRACRTFRAIGRISADSAGVAGAWREGEAAARSGRAPEGMIEPPSRQRRGTIFRPAAVQASHQNRLDDTLRKSGIALALVGFFVDELLGGPRPALPCAKRQQTNGRTLYAFRELNRSRPAWAVPSPPTVPTVRPEEA